MPQPLDIIFDARCCQDSAYSTRGIGRHSVALVRNAREIVGTAYDVRLSAVTDNALPRLPETIASLFDETRPNGYRGVPVRPAWFVELSPMTHDPLFVARLVEDPQVLTAAVVYDFIPEMEPARYLPSESAKLDYSLSKFWLSRFDLFWPISRASGLDLQRHLRVPDTRMTVTGAAINVDFGALGTADRYSGPPQHVLVVGGVDSRKNVEVVVRAHAGSMRVKDNQIALVITGPYPEQWFGELRALYENSGGMPQLLVFPGHVSADELLKLYQRAFCVVVPSRLEGFSLPVVEAMAARVPVIASRIPVHEELIACADLLFAPDDVARITSLIDRCAESAGFRAGVVQKQDAVWPQFVERSVSQRAWGSIMARAAAATRAPAAALVNRGRRPSVAVMTPLLPDETGVAHFSAPFLEEIAKHVDLHVFTETETPSPVRGAVSVRPLAAPPTPPALGHRFDRVVGVMGNSRFHLGVFDALLNHGGACVAHDVRLLGLYWNFLGEERTRRIAERELKRPLRPGEMETWLEDESKLGALYLGEIMDTSSPMFFHSREAVRLARERYGRESIHLPFAAYRTWSRSQLGEEARQQARAELGMERDEIVLTTFGFIHRTKSPQTIVAATELLLSWNYPVKLYFVGALIDPQIFLDDCCRQSSAAAHIKIVDQFVDEEHYRKFLLAADVGIQLRTYGFGQPSGGLQDCIAAGLPTVANDNLSEAIEAPAYVSRVPDNTSPLLVAQAIAEIIDGDKHAGRLRDERETYLKEHSFQVYTRRMLEAQGIAVERTG